MGGSSSGKKGGGQTEVSDYYLSVHAGVCHGPATITGIYISEKLCWEGAASSEDTITIDRPDLFGGNKKEGGFVGDVRLHPGLPAATSGGLPEVLASKLGLTSATAPGFFDLCWVWFAGKGGLNGGALWSTNSPYLKSFWVRVKRVSDTFTAKAGEPSNYADMPNGQVNPAHMIYECLVNSEWGKGESPAMIDVGSFQDCAKTFYEEGFGLSMMWAKSSDVESFVGEVLDHVQSALFLNPVTGLWTLKAIRADYDPDALTIITPDIARVTNFQRKAWGETVNEIVLTWTNPNNEQEETITVHDLANIEMQGAIVSDSRNYYGIRSADLAAKIAARDIRTASTPLATFELETNRQLWTATPQSVWKLSSPEHGINELVIRVQKIDYGRPGDTRIKISAIEDIFGQPQAAYDTPGDSSWENTSTPPAPLDYVEVVTLPVYMATKVLGAANASAADYPETLLGVLGASISDDTNYFDLQGEYVLPNGDLGWRSLGTKMLTARSNLTVALAAEAQSTLTGDPFGEAAATKGISLATSTFIRIGGADDTAEICLIAELTSGTYTVWRGVLDTTPREWPMGTPVWYLDSEGTWGEETTYSDGDVVSLKCLPSTSLGTLNFSSSPTYNQTLTGRPHYPLRPANVSVNGVYFDALFDRTANPFTVTWANRNRLTEDSQIVPWDAANVTGEDGQTTTVTLLDVDRNIITTYNGLTGTSYAVPRAALGARTVGIIRVTSKRDGFESFQGHEVFISTGVGYGTDYGNNYGSTS